MHRHLKCWLSRYSILLSLGERQARYHAKKHSKVRKIGPKNWGSSCGKLVLSFYITKFECWKIILQVRSELNSIAWISAERREFQNPHRNILLWKHCFKIRYGMPVDWPASGTLDLNIHENVFLHPSRWRFTQAPGKCTTCAATYFYPTEVIIYNLP